MNTKQNKGRENNNTKIFKDESNNIENKLSNFNQHRLAVIRHKIEDNQKEPKYLQTIRGMGYKFIQ